MRRDRRYMRERDMYMLREIVKTRLSLELPPIEELIEKALEIKPKYVWAITGITHCYIALGRDDEACETAKEIISVNPNFSVNEYGKTWPPMKDQATKEQMIAAWLKAGLPE